MKGNLSTQVLPVHIIPPSSWAKADILLSVLFRIMFDMEHFSDGEHEKYYISHVATIETSPIVQNKEALLI